MSEFGGPPDRTAEGIRIARRQILPVAREQRGFQGIYLLHDPQSGRSLSVTLWETAEDMSVSEQSARRARSASARASGDAVLSVARYRVVLCELVSAPERCGAESSRASASAPPRGL
ncbi:hypothetical protein [Rubrobacter radiotolerans]|uniref:ABM domain-containing protein n=1 Tax=Rubrobacter radiotolerans TaxID=42256 RepID=A0AB35T6T0_RUBRA|nr:hypothetical protein [Rubrobacter radiotolerans]MDX5895252.1 hypothetical protein [Rubrobacter radiotolerans]